MKFILQIILPVAVVFLLLACTEDGDNGPSTERPWDIVWIDYGVIKMEEDSVDGYAIIRDDGAFLEITSTLVPQYYVDDGQRVMFNYNILEEIEAPGPYKHFKIKLNGYYDLLTKGIVRESYIQEDAAYRNDSIGNDPITVSKAWFSGDYININYKIFRANSDVKHLISLVYDDIIEDDAINIALRHNAYGEVSGPNYIVYLEEGMASFKLSQLVPEGKESAIVRLHWNWYNSEDSIESYASENEFRPLSYMEYLSNESAENTEKANPVSGLNEITTFVK